jgi:hypothetical protein
LGSGKYLSLPKVLVMKMFWAYCRLGLEIFIRQKSRNRKIFNQLMQNNFTIDAALSSRIRLYTLQSTITNLAFSVLRGYRPSKDETACDCYWAL